MFKLKMFCYFGKKPFLQEIFSKIAFNMTKQSFVSKNLIPVLSFLSCNFIENVSIAKQNLLRSYQIMFSRLILTLLCFLGLN